MTTLDPTIQRAVDDAELEAEMQSLLSNKPSYREALPGTNPDIEPGKARALTSTAAEIPVWNRETGEESIVLFDALRARMRQRFPEDHPNPAFRGQRVYTMKREEAPKAARGKLSCPLSADSPDREEVAALGFGHIYCRKPAYFQTDMDVDLHVEKNHQRFYAIRERERERQEREEDRAEQRALREALLKMAGGETRGTRARAG